MLYGLNTLGAAFGSLAAAYLAFPYLGIFNSILLAASLNCLIAISTFALHFIERKRHADSTTLSGLESLKPVEQSSFQVGRLQVSAKVLCMVAGFLGFTALSYEIVWIRLIRIYTGSSTYAFTTMLSTFLIGLVLGSFFYNRHLRLNPGFCSDMDGQIKLLCKSQLGAAACSLCGLLALPTLTVLNALANVINGGKPLTSEGSLWLWYGISFCLLILPSTFIGLGFPAIGGLAAATGKSVARAVGSTYAANTLGCILGSLVSGLVFIPLIGSQ